MISYENWSQNHSIAVAESRIYRYHAKISHNSPPRSGHWVSETMRNITKSMPSFVSQPISDVSWSHTLLPYYTRGNFSPPRSSGEFQAVERTISGLAWEACKGRFLWLRAQKTAVRGFAAGREPASLFSAGHHPFPFSPCFATKSAIFTFAGGWEPASPFSSGHLPGSRFSCFLVFSPRNHLFSPRNHLFSHGLARKTACSRSPVAGNRQSPFSSGHHRERVFPVFSCFRHEISCFHVVSPKKLHVHHRRRPGTAKSFFGRAPPGNTFFPFPHRFASKSAVFTWFRHRTGCPRFVDAGSLYIDLGTSAQSKVEPHPLYSPAR